MAEKKTGEVLIKKADGTTEPFKASKLKSSLNRAGASKPVIEEIVKYVESELKDGTTTKKIYKDAFMMLQEKEEQPVAAKYSLKKAVFDLGPSGFPFEDFVAEIYRAKGFKASTGVMVKGKCAEHEVDLMAVKKELRCGGEVKFHNRQGIKSDLKVALYVYARFDDLINAGKIDEGILVTNTKFTHNAIKYGECVGIKLISWNYPKEGDLYSLIGETGLHPVTCLTTIPKQNKKRLIDDKIVLCRDIKNDSSLLEKHGIKADLIPEILNEIDALCQPGAGV